MGRRKGTKGGGRKGQVEGRKRGGRGEKGGGRREKRGEGEEKIRREKRGKEGERGREKGERHPPCTPLISDVPILRFFMVFLVHLVLNHSPVQML